MNHRESILQAAREDIQANPQIRWGQAVFNAACAELPEAANLVRGTGLDCFYRNERVDAFLDEVCK